MLDTAKSLLSSGKPTLQKAKIMVDGGDELEVQFNPQTLTISKSVSWHGVRASDLGDDEQADLNAPIMVFAGGKPATFDLDLIFDTTALDNQDVRGFTDRLLAMTLMGGGDSSKKEEDPPMVQFIWGDLMLFTAVIKHVEINFTMFLASGTPVRARAKVSFIQAFDEDGAQASQNPTSRTDPRKTHLVHAGDRLDVLAYQEYGRADMWRTIAEANHLDDPTRLQPGQILILPPRS